MVFSNRFKSNKKEDSEPKKVETVVDTEEPKAEEAHTTDEIAAASAGTAIAGATGIAAAEVPTTGMQISTIGLTQSLTQYRRGQDRLH